jgi:hypothetical protein
VFVVALSVGAAAWYEERPNGVSASYVTAPVTRGTVEQTIAASGTVNPVTVV